MYDDFTDPPEPRMRLSAHFMQDFKQLTDGEKSELLITWSDMN